MLKRVHIKGEDNLVLHSQLSRCSTARGSVSGLFLGGPTKDINWCYD